MPEKRIRVKGVGEVRLVKKRNVKYLRISVKYPDIVRVSIPYYSSFRQAERFIDEKIDWIVKSLKKVKNSRPQERKFIDGEVFNTRHHQIKIQRHEGENINLKINGEDAIVFIPDKLNVAEESIQTVIKKAITEVLRKEAKENLPDLVSEYCNKFNIRIGKLSFRNAKTVWGSCSSKNNISLNVHIMRLPDYLIEYVILHELAHTLVRNHSEQFWDTLEKMLPNARAISKEMRKFSPTIYGTMQQ